MKITSPLEIKVRYVYQCIRTKNIKIRELTLEEIEQGMHTKPFYCKATDGERFNGKIIARDQWTGLLDKNDKEIYYRDIIYKSIEENLKGPDSIIGTFTVIWDDFRTAWWLKNIKQYENERYDSYCQLLGDPWDRGRREVIGNVHQNPAILIHGNTRKETTLEQFA